MVPKDGNYHIAADSVTGVLRRSVGRRPAPSAITIVPPVSGAITIVARPDCPDLAVTATFSPPTMEESQESLTEFTFSHLESELPSSTPAESSEAPESSASSSKRASLPRRMTGIFRHKRSGREGEKSVRSPSRSLSPTRQLVPDFKSEREESEIASGRVPHVRNLDDREVQQTKFVNPFKRKARPSSAGVYLPFSRHCSTNFVSHRIYAWYSRTYCLASRLASYLATDDCVHGPPATSLARLVLH